jgi:CheY-like chemotaxis protein
MTYTAIIVEDNPVDAEILSDYLNKYFPEITIVAAATSVAATKKNDSAA